MVHPAERQDQRGAVRRGRGAAHHGRVAALRHQRHGKVGGKADGGGDLLRRFGRSEEHTSELQSLMRISYAVFCLKKKNNTTLTRISYAKTIIYTNINIQA